MVYRVYVEKLPALAQEARGLLADLTGLLGLNALTGLRIVNRYDAEGLDRALFDLCKTAVFSEPQLDTVYDALPAGPEETVFAVEYLPGQFDQRADSAAQCIQILSRGERPTVRTARVYLLTGDLSADELAAVKKYVINPVESREAALDRFDTLAMPYEPPADVAVITGFCGLDEVGLDALRGEYGLAMDGDDLCVCRDYFRSEDRDPTFTELKVIDTYWSDHCRHTTFHTTIDGVTFESDLLQRTWEDYLETRRTLGRDHKPVNLMDLGTISAKALKAAGLLPGLDESEEINACTVKVELTVDGVREPWLLLFKNETHNHPTEIEPFGGAATCIGGAIRDPLSGRAFVYAAMRVTGGANPLAPVGDTLPGKLPQRKLVTTAAAGYSSYGNQIGLATGQVDELYHPGYAAKRMEIGAVIAAAPARNVRRERPADGDAVLLLGGRTGRDGCGGATGSSKAHDLSSLESCGAEVQKGNAPEEHKLQRLFRSAEAAPLIKRCNDFGAGGVSVAIGELADGLTINLDAVPKKYEGLDGTELAISESQERMAVVVAAADEERFKALAAAENLECTRVATVTESPRLVMTWRGVPIVDLARSFLDTNGAEKHTTAVVAAPAEVEEPVAADFCAAYEAVAADLATCSRRGLAERFDATIGAGTVLMPFGGIRQRTPIQAMAHKISLERGETDTCSLMSWGFDPAVAMASPYHSAYLAVVESVCKLVATGGGREAVYLTFQEYFERLGREPRRWGKPVAALLGAYAAQKALGVAAIGGKDSMSGSFEHLDVPPTLVSFAVTTARIGQVFSPEFKGAGHRVCWLEPEYDGDGLPTGESLQTVFATVRSLASRGALLGAWTLGAGGAAEGVLKMSLGNGLGFAFDRAIPVAELFVRRYGSFLLELAGDETAGRVLGVTTDDGTLSRGGEVLPLARLEALYEGKLESVYPCNITDRRPAPATLSWAAGNGAVAPAVKTARPTAFIPVFPGTNCEYDTARALEEAGITPRLLVVRNLTADGIARSVEEAAAAIACAQMIMIPGGFSGGDEPDGSAKFITALFRSPSVKAAVTELLEERDGLMLGICNGFQALIKLGLVPYGAITHPDPAAPTLTFNTIGRHQSKLVRTRVVSNRSPWLAGTQVGEVYTVPISHGEGRFLADEAAVEALAAAGQIATQYVDLADKATYDVQYNPNGSIWAVEGITSPDGRVLGKMGHSERVGPGLYRNVPGVYDMKLFRSAARYFRGQK